MAIETEIKLSLSARTASQLGSHALLAGVPSQRQLLVNTYYDTPDNRLRGERLVAVSYTHLDVYKRQGSASRAGRAADLVLWWSAQHVARRLRPARGREVPGWRLAVPC